MTTIDFDGPRDANSRLSKRFVKLLIILSVETTAGHKLSKALKLLR